MVKKKFRLGVAVSNTFQFIVKFPKFVIFPLLLELFLGSVRLYMLYQVPFFSAVSRADRLVNPNRYTPLASSPRSLYSFAFMFLSILVAFIILNGYIHIVKKWVEQKREPEWKDFFTWNFSLFGQYIVLSLLIGLRVWLGLILLIIPGFMMMAKYVFAPYVLIDQKLKTTDSLEISANLVKDVKGQVFGLIVLYVVLILAPSFYLSYTYSFRHNASLLPFINMMYLLSNLITNISQVVLSCLYFDLSAQQVELDKHPKKTEETIPPIPLEALMRP
jgi:hypothetical protein